VPDYEAVNPPDVFTPNNDNYNEAFEIQFLPPNSQLIIYNRWGRIVYQSNNYQNDWNGDNLSDGVYYYILTLPSGNTTKGTVTILKN
jgi:gliding motility-associated-like protein